MMSPEIHPVIAELQSCKNADCKSVGGQHLMNCRENLTPDYHHFPQNFSNLYANVFLSHVGESLLQSLEHPKPPYLLQNPDQSIFSCVGLPAASDQLTSLFRYNLLWNSMPQDIVMSHVRRGNFPCCFLINPLASFTHYIKPWFKYHHHLHCTVYINS